MSGYHNNNYASRGSGGGLFVSSSVPTAGLFGVSRGSKQQLEKQKQQVEEKQLEDFVRRNGFFDNIEVFKQFVSNLKKSVNEYNEYLNDGKINTMPLNDESRKNEFLLFIFLKKFIEDFLTSTSSKNIFDIYADFERRKLKQTADVKRQESASGTTQEVKEQDGNDQNRVLSNINECEASLQKLFIAVNTYFFVNEHISGISSSDTVFKFSVSSIFWQNVLIDLIALDNLLASYNAYVNKIKNYKSYNTICKDREDKNTEYLKYIDILKKKSIDVKNYLISRDSEINKIKQHYSTYEQAKVDLERQVMGVEKNMRNSNLIADILGNSEDLESLRKQQRKQPSSIAANTSSQNRRVNGLSSVTSFFPF